MRRGNRNRATLAVTRKIVACLPAGEHRKPDFVPAGDSGGTEAA